MGERGTDCLSQPELQVVRDAAPGKAPDALAQHLAGCRRCQERLLFGAERQRKAAPRDVSLSTSVRRFAVMVFCLIVMIVIFVWSLRRLTGE